MPKMSKKGQEKMHIVMHEFKEGTLESNSGDTVTNRKQAIAIELSKVREVEDKISSKTRENKNSFKRFL
jgi:hypothetical protein